MQIMIDGRLVTFRLDESKFMFGGSYTFFSDEIGQPRGFVYYGPAESEQLQKQINGQHCNTQGNNHRGIKCQTGKCKKENE